MKFSEQQIIDINYRTHRIAASEFDEDDVRILLLRLREYLKSQPNASNQILVDLGDGIAHSIRDRGPLYDRIKASIETLQPSPGKERLTWGDLQKLPFRLLDADEIVDALITALVNSDVVLLERDLKDKFEDVREQIIVAIMTILHGMTFLVRSPNYEEKVTVRTELDFSYFHPGNGDLRLAAVLPIPNGGTYEQWILNREVPESAVDRIVPKRVDSACGHCECLRLVRSEGRLKFQRINAHIGIVQFAETLRKKSYNVDSSTAKRYTPKEGK